MRCDAIALGLAETEEERADDGGGHDEEPAGQAQKRSNGNDADQLLQADEIRGISAVKIQAVRVGGRSDEQIDESAARLLTLAYHRGRDKAVAANGHGVERNWLQLGFDFLQPSLSFRRLRRCRRQQWTGCQFGGSDSRNRNLGR